MNDIKIPLSLRTLERLKFLSAELDLMRAGRHLSRQDVSADFLALIAANNIHDVTRDALNVMRATITQAIDHHKIVRIITPIALDSEGELAIIQWLRSQIGEHVLVSFRTDSQMVGGVIIHTPAHRYDASLAAGQAAGKARLKEMIAG